MTDATPTPPAPEQPAAPAYTPAPAAAGPKQTLSIVGFILGIASVVVLSWTGILGIAAGIAAIIVSRRGKKTEPGAPSWMHTVGLITGIVGIILSLIIGIIYIAGIVVSLLLPAAVIGSYGN
jgi:hypothetical protein